MGSRFRLAATLAMAAVLVPTLGASPTTLRVAAGGNLQAAINNAQPGDVILLEPGATFTGNFVLPNKGSSTSFITIRTDAPEGSVPPAGTRMTPAYESMLATIRSSNTMAALSTAPGAHHWRIELLQFKANARGFGEIIALGSGGSDQSTLESVPHNLVFDRVLVRGDPVIGQKRGIALNSASTTITNSYIAECKGSGFDSQAIAGWNGPGPFTITNNYLEGAGENFMLGGASPKIPNMIPADLTFTRNHVAKPLSWRNPILATPSSVVATTGTNGALPAGTYYYFVVAGAQTAEDAWVWSAKSAEVAATVGAGGLVTLEWTASPNAKVYRVYRGTVAGTADRFFDAAGPTFTDTGSLTPKGTDNGSWIKPSFWSVKNLFELKEANRAVVDGNLFEYVWKESQNGYAILFTPRNQDNTSPWIFVRDVTFSNNIVRHAGAGVQILGYDDYASTSSQKTQRIRIVNNLFEDVGFGAYTGAGRFLLIAHGPEDVTVDHNTVVQRTEFIYVYGGTRGAEVRATNFAFTNNLVKHTVYGVIGDGRGAGNDTINAYLMPGTFTGNAIACVAGAVGCSAGNYPAGNRVMSEAEWQSQFVDYAAGDYRVQTGSVFASAGTDGRTLGADMAAIQAAMNPAPPTPPPPPPPVEPPPPPPPPSAPLFETVGDGDRVIYPTDVTALFGSWSKVADDTTVRGVRLATPDGGRVFESALATPSDYFEATFEAEAGVKYRLWVRMQALGDSPAKDSVWVQFSDSVGESGAPAYRIGTPSALAVNLEDCSNCGTLRWGWQTRAVGLSDTGEVWFQASGTHTIRVQLREEGAQIDQILLSPVKFQNAAPGPFKNDWTLVMRSPAAPRGVVVR